MRHVTWVARMESRGPQFPAKIRANYQLGRRLRRANPTFSNRDVDSKLADQLDADLGRTGVPSPRTVSDWNKTQPDFPERAVRNGVIGAWDLLPIVRPFLGHV